jgi:hypothetical protein
MINDISGVCIMYICRSMKDSKFGIVRSLELMGICK